MSNKAFAEASPSGAKTVTPSDTLPNRFGAFYVGGAGNVKVTDIEGNATTFTAVPVGFVIYLNTQLIWATGTTATNIVGIGPLP